MTSPIRSPRPNKCCYGWEDARASGLGYLWIENRNIMNYSEAVEFCRKENSHLIEIDSPAQLSHAVNKMKIKSIKAKEFRLGWSAVKGWWGGASDSDKEGRWVWEQTGKPVERFLWADNEPNSHGEEDNLCFLSWFGYKGADAAGSHNMYPLCQIKRCKYILNHSARH